MNEDNTNQFGFDEKDLQFLTEWVDSHLDDVQETIYQLREYESKIPEDSTFSEVFKPTLEYLMVCAGALDRASMDLLEVNFQMFKDKKEK